MKISSCQHPIDLRPRRAIVAVHKSVIRVRDLEIVAYCSRRKVARTSKDWAQVSCGKCLTRLRRA